MGVVAAARNTICAWESDSQRDIDAVAEMIDAELEQARAALAVGKGAVFAQA